MTPHERCPSLNSTGARCAQLAGHPGPHRVQELGRVLVEWLDAPGKASPAAAPAPPFYWLLQDLEALGARATADGFLWFASYLTAVADSIRLART